ncbi:MAG: Ig-like domain-containing protein [Actinomycetota bacterium]
MGRTALQWRSPAVDNRVVGIIGRDRPSRGGRRAMVSFATLTLVLAGAASAPPGLAVAGVAAGTDVKVEAGLLAASEAREVDFWVVLRDEADLRTAAAQTRWDDRGRAVVDRLQGAARASQAGLVGWLEARGADHQAFWISNAVLVRGDGQLVRQVAARPEVESIVADRALALPGPGLEAGEAAAAAVEWNVAAIKAPEAWGEYGARGEGIVVANIDTGVQYDHPALVGRYRGNTGTGFDHDYNWYDPARVCGNPSVTPCDNQGHGTHTMGTVLGAGVDGQPAIGVAPGATWVAAKGCESNYCSTSSLLGAGQWVLAPTDMAGGNPRPDLRPNVVNNSWSGGGQNFWYQDVVEAWVASGIFPVFSNGNSGPGCNSSGSPADYPEAYAVGASTSAGAIASFSSRGSPAGLVKPDITAPGQSVRSSTPGGAYGTMSGTSMAAPHVAGTVALMWSVAPALLSDVATTRLLLDQTAVDVADLSCGGTPEDNGVWGEGLLDARAAVEASPRGPLGTLAGTVTDAVAGAPVAGARAQVTGNGALARTSYSDDAGAFRHRVPPGTYQVEVTAFGYHGASTEVVVLEDETTPVAVGLLAVPRYGLSGSVVDGTGAAVVAAKVAVSPGPVAPQQTAPSGAFAFGAVPAGTYLVTVTAGGCFGPETREVALGADLVIDVVLDDEHSDGFGYRCRPAAAAYVEASTVLPLSGLDVTTTIDLPFPFSFYGTSYTRAHVSSKGTVNFVQPSVVWTNRPIPDTPLPNGAVYAFWDDLWVDGSASVRTGAVGTEPHRRFVVEWRNVRFYSSPSLRFDFEVVLDQSGGILYQYRGLFDDNTVRGGSATIGIENATGTDGLSYSHDAPVLEGSAAAVAFRAAWAAGNVAPDAVDDSATTPAGQPVAVDVLANDVDPDGDALAVTGTSSPVGSTATVGAGGHVTFVPAPGFVGATSFTYDVADGRGGTDRATVAVSVVPGPEPVANDDAAVTAEDTAVDVAVLANDAPSQAGPLTVATVSVPAHGTAVIGAAGTHVRYTPALDFHGQDSFTYVASDGQGGSAGASVTVTVTPVQDPPVAVADAAEVVSGGQVTIDVLANDSDPDGDPLSIVGHTVPGQGTVSVNVDKTLAYTSTCCYSGPDSFVYTVSDGKGATAQATVAVTVMPGGTTTTTTTSPPPTTTTTTSPHPTTTTTTPPLPAVLGTPYSSWMQPSSTALDGIGTWVIPANAPAAAAGQVPAAYVYGLTVKFTASTAQGMIGLSTGPSGKAALLTVNAAGGQPQTRAVPLAWTANRAYFLYFHDLGGGQWGGWAFDQTASKWTTIGTVSLPSSWGRVAPTSVTSVGWWGQMAPSCAAYPRADVYFHRPTGYVGGNASALELTGHFTGPGSCAGQAATGPPGWARNQTGSP